MSISTLSFNWQHKKNWLKSAKNTAWCLLGCSIGDNLTILYFQHYASHIAMGYVMVMAMLMGLITSLALETVILLKQMPFKEALRIAFGMSFISMLMMETSANVTAIILAGGNRLILHWWSLLPSWLIGFVSAWIYNYYKITKYGKSCHG